MKAILTGLVLVVFGISLVAYADPGTDLYKQVVTIKSPNYEDLPAACQKQWRDVAAMDPEQFFKKSDTGEFALEKKL